MANVFGTLLHSKDKQEVQELEKEGHKAISIHDENPQIYLDDEDVVMAVGEEKTVTQPNSLNEPDVKELIHALLRWINDVLEGRRLIVRDIVEDLYDGQVLGELIAELSGEDIDVIPVTQSAYMQKNKLRYLLDKLNKILGIRGGPMKWDVQSIHSKDPVAILHMLVAMARYFRCPYTLPRNVRVKRILLKQLEHKLDSKIYIEEITGENIGPTAPPKMGEKDVFDKLFKQAPDKLETVKKTLCQFCTRVLQEMDIVVSDIESQFHNGVYLVMMLGLLEGYYVPLYMFHHNPVGYDEKLDNVKLALRLMEESKCPAVVVKAEDIVHKDLKSTFRVIYSIFTKYKSTLQSGAGGPRQQATPSGPQPPVAVSTV
jgi:parvin